MPLRVIGYDGAAYRRQLLKDEREDAEIRPRYPVVTLVLYFGYERHWDYPLTLSGCLEIPQALRPYVRDYGFNLFAVLTQDSRFEEIINREPGKGEIRNMCEVLDQAIARGRAEGRDETLLQSIRNLMANLKMTAEQVMDALSIPKEEQPRYLTMLKG